MRTPCCDCDRPTRTPAARRCKRCYLTFLTTRHRRTRAKRARAASIAARMGRRFVALLSPSLTRLETAGRPI